jgi:hypothetical protein
MRTTKQLKVNFALEMLKSVVLKFLSFVERMYRCNMYSSMQLIQFYIFLQFSFTPIQK